MKKGDISKIAKPITQRKAITAPIEIEVRGDNQMLTLMVAGKPVGVFRGMCIHLLKAQEEYEKAAF